MLTPSRSRLLALVVCAGLGVSGCREAHVSPDAPGASAAMPPPAAYADWGARRGRCVIVEGYVGGGGKSFPQITTAAWSIGVILDGRGDDVWTALRHGARARVRGVVGERADLPVFIQKPGELPMQGMPVPEGTDLEKARRRWVIERATVEVLRSAPQVEADLMARVGQKVSLDGIVWSLNDNVWFNVDGTTVHLEGQDAVPGWTILHGTPRTLQGHLTRRPMPRLDQITLKEHPDVTDAFVLTLRATAPHPATKVVDCP